MRKRNERLHGHAHRGGDWISGRGVRCVRSTRKKNILAQNGTAAIWEKAVFYHVIHAVMLFLLAGRKPFAAGAWWYFLAGIVIFSGSLYLLAVTNEHWLGAITPFGGASFLAGWAWLFFSAAKCDDA